MEAKSGKAQKTVQVYDWGKTDESFAYTKEIEKYYKKLVRSLAIEGEVPIIKDMSISMLTEELDRLENVWEPLDVVLYFRGMADVEHIFLMGFDSETKKLKAIYFN